MMNAEKMKKQQIEQEVMMELNQMGMGPNQNFDPKSLTQLPQF